MGKIKVRKDVAEEVTSKLQANKNIFHRGQFDAYKIKNMGVAPDGCVYDLDNPVEKFYYDLKIQFAKADKNNDVEKGIRTVVVPPSNGRKGYQYNKMFPDNKRDNMYHKKENYETEEEKIKRYIWENGRRLTDKKFLDLSKEEVKKLINQLRSCHYYDDEGIHVAYGRKEKLSKNTNVKEMKGARVLRDLGIEVFLLPDMFAYGKNGSEKKTFGDAIALHKNHVMDFKQVDGENVGKNYSHAMQQGHDCLLYITTPFMSLETVKDKIRECYDKKHISKKRYKMNSDVIVYLEYSNETYLLKYGKEGKLLKTKDLSVYKASLTKATAYNTLSLNNVVGINKIISQQNNLSSKKVSKSLKPDYNGEDRKGKTFDINITDITENNKQQKLEQVNKALNAIADKQPFMIKHIPADSSINYGNLLVRITDFDRNKIEKAVHKIALSLDADISGASKGESFVYKAQEELTDKYFKELTNRTRAIYNFVIDYFDLPDIRIVSKAGELRHKGKILYNPESGLPIKEADWKKFVVELEKYLNRNYTGIGKKIVLSAESLGIILDRLSKTNSFEAMKKMSLAQIKAKRYDVDWISESVKNMEDKFGDVISRERQARIQVAIDSAAQRVTRVSDDLRNNIQQIIIDGVRDKQSKSVVAQNLFDKCASLNRDMQRIADTEIQMAATNSYIKEEVYNTPKNEKVYFKRFEMMDANTCKKCRKINGTVVLWSDVPLPDEHIKDEYAKIAIWEGKTGGDYPESICHPYCRGTWIREYPDV